MHDGVGVVQHPLDPVLGHDDRDGEVVHEPGDGRQHLLGAGGVEGRGGLVEQDDAGVRREHRPDRHPLLLSPRELAQRDVAQLGDAEQVEGLLDPLAHGGGRKAELLHAVGELLLDGVGDEPGERVLPDDADQVGEVAGPVVAGVAAVEADVAGQRAPGEVRHPPAHRPEQGRLARAGAPDDEGELALVDGEVDAPQHGLGRPRQGDGHLRQGDGVLSHAPAPPRVPHAAAAARPAAGAAG